MDTVLNLSCCGLISLFEYCFAVITYSCRAEYQSIPLQHVSWLFNSAFCTLALSNQLIVLQPAKPILSLPTDISWNVNQIRNRKPASMIFKPRYIFIAQICERQNNSRTTTLVFSKVPDKLLMSKAQLHDSPNNPAVFRRHLFFYNVCLCLFYDYDPIWGLFAVPPAYYLLCYCFSVLLCHVASAGSNTKSRTIYCQVKVCLSLCFVSFWFVFQCSINVTDK